MNQFITPAAANAVLDKYIDEKIEQYIRDNVLPNLNYTHDDLNKMVNDDETLLEFIRDSEFIFSFDEVDLDQMSDDELNMYIAKLDMMYVYVQVQEEKNYLNKKF